MARRRERSGQERIADVGLEAFPSEALPTEEAMLRFERLARAAAVKGRLYVGSAEGEDLQAHFRPSWCRAPDLDMARGYAGAQW